MTIGAERGEIAEIGSPVNLVPAQVDRRAPWRWTTASMVVAALLLALGNGTGLSEWADDLPPGPVAAALQEPLHAWAAFTVRWHQDRPARWLRSQWMQARKARFGNEQPDAAGAADSTAAP